jgi:hypothetical protein
MRSLTRDELATLEVRPEDRLMLAREFSRAGLVIVCGIQERSVRSVKRYTPTYFQTLCREGRLPLGQEEQLVIGLD